MPGKIMIVRHEAHTGLSATYSAATALGAAVKVTGAKTIGPCTAITDIPVGTSHHEVTSAQITAGDNRGTFRLKGDVIPMIADAAITAGTKVEPSTTAGRVKTQTTGTLAGVAWTAATAAGQEILVIVL